MTSRAASSRPTAAAMGSSQGLGAPPRPGTRPSRCARMSSSTHSTRVPNTTVRPSAMLQPWACSQACAPSSSAATPAPCSSAGHSARRAKGESATARGGRCMMSGASGSASKTMEQAGSMSSSISTMCTGSSSAGQCSSVGASASAMMGTCTANTKRVALRTLSSMRRPWRMAATIWAKLSCSSTSAAASRATSVPRSPMAMPTCAALSAGASFTPSPVMATTAPSSRSSRTRRSLCAGLRRAHMSTWCRRARRALSSRPCSSSPVITSGRSDRPTWRAMARAVAGWSPVIITTRTPAARHCARASGTSGRGGSASASRPRNSKSKSCWLAGQSAPWAAPVQCPRATPSTRRPRSARDSTWARRALRPASSRWHRSATASGAPLVASWYMWGWPLANTRVMARMSLDSGYTNSGSRPSCTCSVPLSHSWPKRAMAFSMGSNGSVGVASRANSTSRWNGSGSALAPAACHVCAGVASSATAMRFWVRVPVLSTASTVMAPRVSTAVMRLVSTCWRAMRQAPRARNTVRMTGISSGRMAMASAMPASRLSSRGRPFHHQPSSTWAVASSNASAPRARTRRRERSCSGERGVSVAARPAPMRPTAVSPAVASTRARPTPRVTTVLACRLSARAS